MIGWKYTGTWGAETDTLQIEEASSGRSNMVRGAAGPGGGWRAL